MALRLIDLGKDSTSRRVSAVCLGTMTWGKQTSEAEAHAQMDLAIKERGVNFVDTSELYPLPCTVESHGMSEMFIGSWFKKNPEWRSKVVISTKVVGYMKSTFLGAGRQPENHFLACNIKLPKSRGPTNHSKQQLFEACNASLARLQSDYIDLFYLHWPDRYVPSFGSKIFNPKWVRESAPFAEIVEGIGALFKSGKIKSWGLSNETAFGVCQFIQECEKAGVPKPIAIQNSFSLLDRSFESDSLAEACFHLGVSLVAFSPLSGGALTGKYCSDQKPPEGTRFAEFDKFDKQFNNDRVREAVSDYSQVAKDESLSLIELALRWIYTRPCLENGVVLLGARTSEQLRQNLDALSDETQLSETAKGRVDTIYVSNKDPVNGL